MSLRLSGTWSWLSEIRRVHLEGGFYVAQRLDSTRRVRIHALDPYSFAHEH